MYNITDFTTHFQKKFRSFAQTGWPNLLKSSLFLWTWPSLQRFSVTSLQVDNIPRVHSRFLNNRGDLPDNQIKGDIWKGENWYLLSVGNFPCISESETLSTDRGRQRWDVVIGLLQLTSVLPCPDKLYSGQRWRTRSRHLDSLRTLPCILIGMRHAKNFCLT